MKTKRMILKARTKIIVKTSFIALSMFLFTCKKPTSKTRSIIFFSKVYPPIKYKIDGALIDNRKVGLWVTTDSLGQVESEETFLDGKSIGEAKVYESGKLIEATKDTIIKDDTVTTYRKYNLRGEIVITGTYINGVKKEFGLFIKLMVKK